MTQVTRILCLIAGTNDPSNSATLAAAFAEGCQSIPDVSVETVTLRNLHIEHFTMERYHKSCQPNDDFCTLQEKIERAHGILIATPIWNFSIPAHLKNVIDRIGAFGLDEETHSKGQLKGKPFSFIFTGGAPLIAWKALMYITTMHLSEAMKYYDGTVISRHFEPKCMVGRGQFGLVVDQRPRSLAKMRRDGARFARIVQTYAVTGKLPLQNRLRHGFFTWAYRLGNRVMYPVSRYQ